MGNFLSTKSFRIVQMKKYYLWLSIWFIAGFLMTFILTWFLNSFNIVIIGVVAFVSFPVFLKKSFIRNFIQLVDIKTFDDSIQFEIFDRKRAQMLGSDIYYLKDVSALTVFLNPKSGFGVIRFYLKTGVNVSYTLDHNDFSNNSAQNYLENYFQVYNDSVGDINEKVKFSIV